MAVQQRQLLAILLLLFYHSKAAIVPDNGLSPHARKTAHEIMAHHGLDLADLSLPPEVITEALFSQTDLLQDQLEQCEEMVRNNLKGDDAAETDGLKVDDEDDDDADSDDDDSEDTLDKKIAQLAVDAFNHHGDEDYDNMDANKASEMSPNNEKELAGAAAENKSEEANGTVSRHKDDVDNNQNDVGEHEYMVYEYEDVGEDDHAPDNENRDKKAKERSEEENKVIKEQKNNSEEKKKGGKEAANDKDENNLSRSQKEPRKEDKDENKGQVEENQATNSPVPSKSKNSEAEKDSIDSDAEETQPPPVEVNISSASTNESHSYPKQILAQGEEVTQDQASVDSGETTVNSNTAGVQGSEGQTTPETDSAKSGEGLSPGSTERPGEADRDNHSEGSRHRRSLSLEQIVMADAAEEGMVRNIHKVTFGQGRIRRQASPQDDIKSWLQQHSSDAAKQEKEEESSIDVLNKMLKTVLLELHRGQSQSSGPSQPGASSVNPTSQKTGRIMEVGDVFHSEKQTDEDSHDILKMADKSSEHDVPNMVEEHSTRHIRKMAEEFLKNHKTRHADDEGVDWVTVQRLLATSRLTSGSERVRRRRSVLGKGLSPERYVPLIDQLVERLNYLQHSIQVCRLLLPQHLHANRTVG
ncbi:hypothetical protein ACOMHN_018812 [Nucella lapillus]